MYIRGLPHPIHPSLNKSRSAPILCASVSAGKRSRIAMLPRRIDHPNQERSNLRLAGQGKATQHPLALYIPSLRTYKRPLS